MKKLLTLISILVLSAGFFQTQAQVGNYLINKAKEASVKAAQKADKAKANSEESSSSETNNEDTDTNNNSTPSNGSSDARANAMMKAMGINTAPVNVNETYNYSGNILMNVQSWNDKGKPEDEIQYKTFMTKDNSGFAMEFKEEGKEKSVMIFDYKNERMIILSDDGETKSGMVMAYSGLAEEMKEAEEESSDVSDNDDVTDYSTYREGMKKTGKSKNIAGYKCDEYIYDDEESHVEMWMTDQLPADLWANMFSTAALASGSMGFYGGFVMEMDQKEKESQERTYMLVKEVNANQATSISTKGYQLISIGGMPQE